MSSSWDKPGPQHTVERLHGYISYWYAFLTVVFGLVMLAGWKMPAWNLVIMGVAVALLGYAHRKVSEAAGRNERWVPGASFLLALLLLFSFPVGTILAIRLMINASKMSPEILNES